MTNVKYMHAFIAVPYSSGTSTTFGDLKNLHVVVKHVDKHKKWIKDYWERWPYDHNFS